MGKAHKALKILAFRGIMHFAAFTDFYRFLQKGESAVTPNERVQQILKTLWKQHEDSEIEFKEATQQLPKNFWDTYSSFANTSGGFIFLGIKEKPRLRVTGVADPQKIITDICNSANNKMTVSRNLIENENIKTWTIDGKKVISIYIPELNPKRKPLYCKNNPRYTYIRKNEGDYQASDEDLRRLLRDASNGLDSELLDEYLMEDLNPESVLAFKNKMDARNPSMHYMEMDNLEFLMRTGVFQIDRKDHRKPKLTVAGLLFLGKLDAIYQKFPHFHLEYINRRGANAQERWRDRVCTGDSIYEDLNVFEFFFIVRAKLKATIEDSFELDENSERRSPIELDAALREALANMLIHADYFDDGTDIKVVVENYFYTFTNPGTMRISTEQFFVGGVSNPRNNTLISFFRKLGISERAGSGGQVLSHFAKENKYEMPELETDFEKTSLKLWTATPVKVHPELDDATKKIYTYIHEQKSATMPELIRFTGQSRYFVRKSLDALLGLHLILQEGKGRATKYLWSPSMIEQLDMVDAIRKMLMRPAR